MPTLLQFYGQCTKVDTTINCIIRLVVHWVSVGVAVLLLAACIKIMIEHYRIKGEIKLLQKGVFGVCILLELCFLVSEFLMMHLLQVKICFQTQIFSLIYYYLYNKITLRDHNGRQERTKCTIWTCRIFYITLGVANLFAVVAGIVDTLAELDIIEVPAGSAVYQLITAALLNIIILVLLAMVAIMIAKFRQQAVDAFKVNHRTTDHFKKNQYLIESLSLYLLTVMCSGVVKLPLSIYSLLSPEVSTHHMMVPKNMVNALLTNDIIILLLKLVIFYLPLLCSQRLFKEMKLKTNGRASTLIRTVTNITEGSSEGLAIKQLNDSEDSTMNDSYVRLN